MTGGSGALYLWPDAVLYVGRDVAPGLHRHSAAHCAVALGAPLTLRDEAGAETETKGAVFVDADIAHSISSPGSDIAILFLEKTRFARWSVREDAGRHLRPGMFVLDAPPDSRLLAVLAAARRGGIDPAEAAAAKNGILSLVAMESGKREAVDPRIEKVLAYIADHADGHPDGATLAALAGLSPGRFQHLFHRHAGMTVRRYLLWCRIRRVILAVHEGANLTAAAHDAGFSDSAHFSRTFRTMTGIAPSEVFVREPRASISLYDS